jgi:phosphatidylglycerophosphate synthase
VPGRDTYLSRWAALHGGRDPLSAGRLERGWLRLMYLLARPLAGLGVLPSAVTCGSVVLAAAAAGVAALGGRWALLAALLVVLSALVDGVDGAVAVLTDRATRWGYVLDSLADRVSEALYVLALWRLGVPGWLCVAAGGLGWLHEYVRARAAAAGMSGIGVVTVAERPTRVVFAAASLVAAGAVPGAGEGVLLGRPATVAVAVWVVVAAAGLAQLLIVVRRAL